MNIEHLTSEDSPPLSNHLTYLALFSAFYHPMDTIEPQLNRRVSLYVQLCHKSVLS